MQTLNAEEKAMKITNLVKYVMIHTLLLFNLCCNERQQQDNRQLDELETKVRYIMKRDDRDQTCVKYLLQQYVDKIDENNIEKQIDDIDKDIFNIKVYEIQDKENKDIVKYMVEYDKMVRHISTNQWAAEKVVKEHFVHTLQNNFTRKDLEQMLYKY